MPAYQHYYDIPDSDTDTIAGLFGLEPEPCSKSNTISLNPIDDQCLTPLSDFSASSGEESSSPSLSRPMTFPRVHQRHTDPLLYSSPIQWELVKRRVPDNVRAEAELTLTIHPSFLRCSSTASSASPSPVPMYLPVRKARRSHSSRFSNSESDCDDSDKDEDYKPESDDEPWFTSSTSRKRRRSSADGYAQEIVQKKRKIAPLPKRPTSTVAIKLPSLKVGGTRASVNRTRVAPPSRNFQVPAGSELERLIKEKLAYTKYSNDDFVCPACSWSQHNERMPDYKRHLKTHLTGLVHHCCGVLLSEASSYSIPSDSEPFEHEGEMRIGGCMRTFSRADALTRHITNPNIPCVTEKRERCY